MAAAIKWVGFLREGPESVILILSIVRGLSG